MLRSAAASWTLFFGLLLIMAGNGLQMVLLGIRSSDAGFSNVATGVMMAGYYFGLFLGSISVPKILNNVGHVRVFGAMAAIASAAVLAHVAIVDPFVWTVMRVMTGFSFAGMYIVCESWLNDQSTNETRGQMLSLYMIVSMGGLALGQLMISLGSETGIGLFLLASVLVSIAVVPILITVGKAPEFSTPEPISLRRIFQISPLAVIGLAINGMAISMVFGMGAVYGKSIGMSSTQIGYFMTAPVIGAMLLQYPVGRLSDRFDRRKVILGVSSTAAIILLIAWQFGLDQFSLLLLCMLLFGGFLFPMYSLCIAHANDFLAPSQMVAVASGLVMVSGAGAVAGSPLAAVCIEFLGVNSFFPLMATAQVATTIVVIIRMTRRASVPTEAQGPFVAIPEAAGAIAATLNPESEWVLSDEEVAEAEDPFKDNPYVN
ncbi:MFS transporter [Alphaproteobacteria bacterium]|nr:MFS transporter [Alphaproteobacteria bacterium]